MTIANAAPPSPASPPSRRPRKPRSVAYAVDVDGAAIALVHMPCGATAKALAADYRRLCDLGFPGDRWLTNAGANGFRYVRLGTGGGTNTMTAARLLLRPPAQTYVRYADGDTLNLRRDNLYVTAGRSKRREAAAMEAAENAAGGI